MSEKIRAGVPGPFERALRAGKFVVTAEVTPPASCAREDLLAKALPLKGLADAVNVTDGAGARAHMAPVTGAAILIENGIEPVLQLACRDRNRIALQGELMAAAAVGARNLLLLRGDDPSAGDQPDAKAVYDVDTRTLMQTAVALRDRGELPSGRKVGGRADFFIGAADLPIDPPPGWKPAALKAKIGAGAQFAQTQFCMNAEVVRRYVKRLAEEGVAENFYLLIGVAVVRSAKSARWIRDNLYGALIPDALVARLDSATDQAAEGRRIAQEFVQQLGDIRGVAGAHLMAPGHEEALPEILAAVAPLRARQRAAAGR
jgi:methylenetetrahydrofolate reductase (NADPH)